MQMSTREQILQAVDIVDVIGERVSLARKGREYVGLCPFHDDHRPSLRVSPAKQIFKCFACGAGGDAVKFVQMIQRSGYGDALATLAQRAGIDLRRSGSGEREPTAARDALLRVMNWAARYFQRQLQAPVGRGALDYAHRRGLSDETIARFGLGYAPDAWDGLLRAAERAGVPRDGLRQAGLVVSSESGRTYDRFRNRLMFPIRDTMGRVVAFGGRTLGDDPAKYLNSPETVLFSKSRVLYGFDVARRRVEQERQIVVVEGYMDVVLLHQHGVEHAVGTLGTSLTEAHARLLTPFAGRIVVCFDSDAAGRQAADRAVATALRHSLDVRVTLLPSGMDPADFVISRGADAFKSLLQSALAALEFKWNLTRAAFEREGDRDRREAVEAFLSFIAEVAAPGGIDPLQQGLLVSRVADLLSLPAGRIYDLLGRKRRRTERSAPGSGSEAEDVSAYEAQVRGLPAALVGAVEELLGLLLTEPGLYPQAKGCLSAVSGHCDAWQRLDRVLDELAKQAGGYTRADVIEHCDDAVLCELVGRAIGRVGRSECTVDWCEAVCDRIRHELEVWQAETLRGRLRGPAARERDQDFQRLLEVARRHRGSLGIGQRGGVPIPPA